MIRISERYSISRKSGFFFSHKHLVEGEAGIEESIKHPSLIDLWSDLKEVGECGNRIMHAASNILEGVDNANA